MNTRLRSPRILRLARIQTWAQARHRRRIEAGDAAGALRAAELIERAAKAALFRSF